MFLKSKNSAENIEISTEDFAIKKGYHTISLATPYATSEKNSFENIEADFEQFLQTTANLVKTAMKEDIDSWFVAKKLIYPQIKRKDQLDTIIEPFRKTGYEFLTQDFMGDLKICWVLDQEKGFSYVFNKLFDMWKISIDEVKETAINNLLKLPATKEGPHMYQTTAGADMLVFESKDGYDASRLLLPQLGMLLAEKFPDGYLAIIPSRDLLVTGSPMAEAKLLEIAKDVFEKDAHPIFSGILKF